MLVIDRLVVVLRQVGIDLRPCAVDHHQANAEAVQQANVIDDAGKVLMLDGFTAQHDDKGFSPMGINIGD